MHVEVTTTVSLVSDTGREITRSVSKHRSSEFELTEMSVFTRHFAAAYRAANKLSAAAIEAVVGTLLA